MTEDKKIVMQKEVELVYRGDELLGYRDDNAPPPECSCFVFDGPWFEGIHRPDGSFGYTVNEDFQPTIYETKHALIEENGDGTFRVLETT